jgi:4-amino-4-deoxy-L-arabinose transferase-like glycosyltransferase
MQEAHMKHRIIAKALTRGFWLIFCAFLALVFLHALSWEKNRDGYTAFTAAMILALGVFAALAVASVLIREDKKDVRLPLLLFIASLFLRLLILHAMGRNSLQLSDFGNAVTASYKLPQDYGQYYNIYPHWYMQIKYLAILRHIGELPAVGLYANAVVSSLSAVLTYSVAAHSLGSKRIGFLAAAIFMLWPAHLFYAVVLSPEYLNIFFCCCPCGFLSRRTKPVPGVRSKPVFFSCCRGPRWQYRGFLKQPTGSSCWPC